MSDLIARLLLDCPGYEHARLDHTEPVAGDASGRRYLRLFLEGGRSRTLILLLHHTSRAPALSGNTNVSQEQAFVTIGRYFEQHGIPVPHIYLHDPDEHAIFCEDLGPVHLYQLAEGILNHQTEEVIAALGDDYRYKAFEQALKLIGQLQAIPHDPKALAFQRFLGFENYRKEISEFSEFYAAPRGLKPAAARALDKVYDGICETLASFPKTLSYFDFNSHNIMVQGEGRLRVIDFQDACLVSPARDIASLINDRGMDDILGRTLHDRLLALFHREINTDPQFPFFYNTTLLHWDLRVSGRFEKLCGLQKTEKYRQWLPGICRRLGRTLIRSYKSIHGLETLLEIASEISPEVREGIEDPWPFPE